MNTFITIIEFIGALSLLAVVHELGHYLVARLFKIEVEEFGLGFPPRIPRINPLFKIGQTEFTLNAIPFGAFVRPKGENDPEVVGGLAAAPPLPRLAVLFGGPVFNLVLGVVMFAIVFSQLGAAPDFSSVLIAYVDDAMPAMKAGIKPGDIIVRANGQAINSIEDLQAAVIGSRGNPVTLDYRREGVLAQVIVTPVKDENLKRYLLGVRLATETIKINSWQEALPAGVGMAYEQIRQLIMLPGRLIQGTATPEQTRVVGPKGMYDLYSQARTRDEQSSSQPNPESPAVNTLWFLAIVSVALGITNLLPFPALDGGRILFVLPELIIRRRVPARFENLVHMIGFTALILFMLYVTTQDILNPIINP